ncbi:MAG TPA: endonuclease [Oceanospirillales bacterium]|nr:endonuclease [Oceanospirillales bacterium]
MKIKIVSYNIHRAIGLDRRFKPQRIIDILNDCDADIALLQEVDEGVPRSRELNLAAEIANACHYPHFELGHNVTLKKGYYGNATLSKYPIIRERNIDLTIAKKKRRGCQHTTIAIEQAETQLILDVFNLHLGLSAKERQKQAGLLFHSQEFSRLNAQMPCIIAGDFNDWRSLLRALFVEAMDFTCATDRPKKNKENAIKTFPSFAPRGGLDRIYYKGNIQLHKVGVYRKKQAKIASDHLPVIAEFILS